MKGDEDICFIFTSFYYLQVNTINKINQIVVYIVLVTLSLETARHIFHQNSASSNVPFALSINEHILVRLTSIAVPQLLLFLSLCLSVFLQKNNTIKQGVNERPFICSVNVG